MPCGGVGRDLKWAGRLGRATGEGERERREKMRREKGEERDKNLTFPNYRFALRGNLIVFSSLELRFGSTSCLRTRFAVLYATEQAEFSNSFPIKKSNFPLIKYARAKSSFG